MNVEVDIQEVDQPAAEDKAYVSQQFRAYNDKQCGVFPSKAVHLFAYAPDRRIIGGLFGEVFWGWLYIETFWVDGAYRGSGIGTSLMDRAETGACKMGVFKAYLETTDFQALGFYEKRGYQIFAQLEDQPPGHTCYYLKKSMDVT